MDKLKRERLVHMPGGSKSRIYNDRRRHPELAVRFMRRVVLKLRLTVSASDRGSKACDLLWLIAAEADRRYPGQRVIWGWGGYAGFASIRRHSFIKGKRVELPDDDLDMRRVPTWEIERRAKAIGDLCRVVEKTKKLEDEAVL